MISNRLEAWIRDRKADIRQAIAAARAEPDPTASPEWFAGLVVSPTSFSRQLGDMQVSLMRANEGHQTNQPLAQTVDPVGVGHQRI